MGAWCEAKTEALRGRHLFTVSRVWSTFQSVIYFSRSWLLAKNKRVHFQKYLRNRTKSISDHYFFRKTMSQLIAIRLRGVRFDVLRSKRTIDCVKFLCVAWWEFNNVESWLSRKEGTSFLISKIETAYGEQIRSAIDEEKQSIGLMKRAKYGIFGPISRANRQHHGIDEPERVRVFKVDLGTEASAAEACVADHVRLRRDFRHRCLRQRGHLHRHQAKSCHANRHQLLLI